MPSHPIAFHVQAIELPELVRFVCCFQNDFDLPIFVQNLHGPPFEVCGMTIGGGRSPNDRLSEAEKLSTSTACVWPDEDALFIFQGEVARPGKISTRSWPNPGYTLLPVGDSHFEIALRLPARQWENNLTRLAAGKRVAARRVHVCIEVLVDPQQVHRRGEAIACDYGQPGYVADTVELEVPSVCILDNTLPKRAAAKRLALGASVDLAGVSLGMPPASTPYVPPVQPPRRKSRGARLV